MRTTSLITLVVAALTVVPRLSDACSIAPATVGILTQTVPVDGVLPIKLNCSTQTEYCSDPASAFEVLDASGSVVAGTLVETLPLPNSGIVIAPTEIQLAWVPTAGWISGATYQFRALLRYRTGITGSFSVAPTVAADQVTLTTDLSATEDYGEGVKCGRSETSCGPMDQYFYPNKARVAALSITMNEDSTWSAQSVLSLEGTTADETVVTSEVGIAPITPEWSIYITNRLPTIAFKKQAEEYCYRVLARKLGQATKTVVAEGCLPHGELPALAPIEDPMKFGFDRCEGPPAGYETEWCQWAAAVELCSEANLAEYDNPQCANHDHVCSGNDGKPSNGSEVSGSSGCQLSSSGPNGSGWGALFAGLVACALVWRRNRPRRSPCAG
jgi:hypothetical protein